MKNIEVLKKALYDGTLAVSRTNMYAALTSLESSQYWTPEEIKAAQGQSLDALLAYARVNCRFYGEYPNLRVDGASVDLGQLPTIGKQDLIMHRAGMVSSSLSGTKFYKTTGGSTGEPVTVVKDGRSFGAEIAAAWRGLGWAGISPGDCQARFWGQPSGRLGRAKAKLIDFIGNRIRISAFDFDDDSMRHSVTRLNRVRPAYCYGYVSILREFATYVRRKGRALTFQPNAVITTAEILDAGTREMIQEVFRCPVFQEYGCGEVGTIAHECEKGRMHINAENVLIEQGAPLQHTDGMCELIVTDLKNVAMPLIRYRIGDLGALSNERCPCGRGLPVLSSLRGRAYDLLVNSAGRRFHPEFFIYIFEDARKSGLDCRGFQVEQVDVDEIVVRLLNPLPDQQRLERFILDRLRSTFSANVRVSFVPVDYLRRERSGKMRVVKSSVTR